ncbi:hypothetical protein NKR23_g494 [Pleurostoma richardsiae]|uniref:AA1-like domain-containing protein n=1 Tax=Pleurostoma richardsiae TaxID=41990 RepID=A0AA38SFD1_9PEZI|nr:hypothetical protein NKR23_g494 [Pleurostoma richardsiae]
MKYTYLLTCLVPLAASFRMYSLPKELVAMDDCDYPEQFTIQKLSTWTATGSNETSLGFTFSDQGTGITTACQKNSTSAVVSKPGLTARYACDDSMVQFIWQNSKLTVIETACSASSGFEAAGSIAPALSCTSTNYTLAAGSGKQCTALNQTLTASFTSLEPTPE